MFVGHYAAALVAKAAEPRAPLWTYVLGCQLIDVAWGGFVMAGIEKLRIDPTLLGSNLDLYSMPYTHSLPAVVAWSLVAALLVRFALKLPWRAAVAVGLVVFSHWVLDFIVHRPDLPLWFGGPKVGLGFWNLPLSERVVEIGLVAVAAVAWTAAIKSAGLKAWPAAIFVAVLVAVQAVTDLGGALPSDPLMFGGFAIGLYAFVTAVSLLFDRPKASRTA